MQTFWCRADAAADGAEDRGAAQRVRRRGDEDMVERPDVHAPHGLPQERQAARGTLIDQSGPRSLQVARAAFMECEQRTHRCADRRESDVPARRSEDRADGVHGFEAHDRLELDDDAGVTTFVNNGFDRRRERASVRLH